MIIMYEKVGFRWDCGFVVVGCCWLWWLLLVVVVVVGVVGCWLLVVAQFRNIQVSFFYSFTPRFFRPSFYPNLFWVILGQSPGHLTQLFDDQLNLPPKRSFHFHCF